MKAKPDALFLRLNSTVLIGLVIMSLMIMNLVACSDQSDHKTISFEVSRSKFVMIIPVKGELEASNSTAISMPGGIFEPQVISWLAEENTLVKKGDIVAKFDTTKYIFDTAQEELRKSQVDITFSTKQNVLSNEEGEISTDAKLIIEEIDLADRFALEDLSIFSKNDVIDSMKNRKYLEARQDFVQWRGDVHQQKSSSELELLDLERQKYSNKLNQYQSAMDKMEIRAPHDGLFVLRKNRRGEKPRVGDITWPGRKIGSLPDLKKLQAKVQILEAEAAGLESGQRVEFTLDAYPEQLIEGKITQIDAIAKSIERESPVKYFAATVEILSQNSDYWRPGIQLRGKIYVIEKNDVLSIPSQAVFRDETMSFVYINQGGNWHKQKVKLGSRSLSLTEITAGISEGDVIALHQPEEDS